MSVQRNYERYLQDQAGIRKTRGIPHQYARHIIKRGTHLIVRGGVTVRILPRELHATKGWRLVPAWS